MTVEACGRLFNQQGEILAEGNCQIDAEHGHVTLHPIVDTPLLSREHGELRLELDDGSELLLSERVIRFRLNVPELPEGFAYRLFFTQQQRLQSMEGKES